MSVPTDSSTERIGRYVLHGVIASGGMATVHFGRMMTESGPGRTVAIKRLHPHLATESEFVAMLVDEGRLATRLRHPNLVSTVEVVVSEANMLLVMEYVHGVSLSVLANRLMEINAAVPPPIAAAILRDTLLGLHAAHEAQDEKGRPLGIVHRDVSPPNILLGSDGVARVADFGIAKATGRLQLTRDGQLKGKLSYMAPEQLSASNVDRRADVYAASIVFWEMLTGQALFRDAHGEVSLTKVMSLDADPPSRYAPAIGTAYDDVVLQGLERDVRRRFATAEAMVRSLEQCGPIASRREVSEWLLAIAGDVLEEREIVLRHIERDESGNVEHEGQAVDAAPQTVPSRRRRRTSALLFAAAVSLLAVGGFAAMRRTQARAAGFEGTLASAPSAALPAASSVSDETTASSSSEAKETHAPPPGDSMTSSTGESVVKTASDGPTTDATRASRLAPRRKAASPNAKGKGRCDPPYDIDEEGVKRYRPHCL